MTIDFDDRQAKSFPENVGDFYCFLAETMGAAGTLLSYHDFSVVSDSMTIKGRHFARGNHQKRDGKDMADASDDDKSRKTEKFH